MTPSPSNLPTQVEVDDRSGPEYTPRLRLKPKAPATGYVDGAWWPHSARLVTGGRSVRLGGYRRQPVDTVEVTGIAGRGIVLAVVASQTNSDQAHATLMAAAHPGDTSPVSDLLAADGN